jgi:hypothetical protein
MIAPFLSREGAAEVMSATETVSHRLLSVVDPTGGANQGALT